MEFSLVKNRDGGQWHRAWVTHADGSSASVKIFMPHDLDHFVIESALGIKRGFWGILAAGGWRRQSQLATARDTRRAAASDLRLDDPVVREHAVDADLAETLVNAIGNQFGNGPDTVAGVRERLRRHRSMSIDAITDQLDDARLTAIHQRRAQLLSDWNALEPGGALRLTWPLGT